MVCDLEAQVGEAGCGDGRQGTSRWRGEVARVEDRASRWAIWAGGKGLRPYPLWVPQNRIPLPPCHNFACAGAAFVLLPRYRIPLPAAGTGVGYPSTTGTG